MSLVQVNFVSKKLTRAVTFNAIIPMKSEQPLKTLYLLHGAVGDHNDYLNETRIKRWALEKNLAVIMPAGENNFYIDQAFKNEYYGEFIAEELVGFTRKMFPLSNRREDTFIAGLSMGGYGALVNGLKYHETFSRIGAFSPGTFLTQLWDNPQSLADRRMFSLAFFDAIFNDISTIKDSDRDYYYLTDQLIAKKVEMPSIYLPIGKQDFLLENVRDFYHEIKNKPIDIDYIEDEGGHDWEFWDRHLKKFIDWLPLESSQEELHSGNVSM